MMLVASKSGLEGTVTFPASKLHKIRAVSNKNIKELKGISAREIPVVTGSAIIYFDEKRINCPLKDTNSCS